MNKKTYITPEMEIMNIETVEMMAASINTSDTTVAADEAWGNERRGSWGDLWSGEE